MDAKIASLTEVRLNSINVTSGMNSGSAFVQGNVEFTISAKSSFSIGGADVEASYVLCRVEIKADAVLKEDEQLMKAEVEFVGRFEFDDVISDEEAAKLIAEREYCEALGAQMQPYVNSKFSDFMNLVGLDIRLPLNMIKLRPSSAS